MRAALLLAISLLTACDGGAPAPAPVGSEATTGEVRARIVPRGEEAVTLRTGASVPVSLPPGFTVYPGARIISNTVVEREGTRRVLIVFETPDSLAKVMMFHRGQAEAAGVILALDVGGAEQASIGGRLLAGGDVTITMRRGPAVTRVEFSAN